MTYAPTSKPLSCIGPTRRGMGKKGNGALPNRASISAIWVAAKGVGNRLLHFALVAIQLTAVLILVLEAVEVPAIDWISGVLNWSQSTFAVGIVVLILAAVLDRLISIEQHLGPTRITVCRDEFAAYEELLLRLRGPKVKTVDLLQASGQTAMDFCRRVCEQHPNAKVRLLLMNERVARGFKDQARRQTFRHWERVCTTAEAVNVMENGQNVEVRYYDSAPGVCSAVVNADHVLAGWYRTFHDNEDGQDLYRIRSHDGATLVASGAEAAELRELMIKHFEKVWSFASSTPDASSAPPTKQKQDDTASA